MSKRDGFILFLSEDPSAQPHWLRTIDGAVVQRGQGANWLAASGMAAFPSETQVLLVLPAAATALHWISHPDLPARQGRAAARISTLSSGILPADQLFAAADENEDPASPHIVAVAARTDMQQWVLWAQHHGLDPDILLPAPLLLPVSETGFTSGVIGGETLLRGQTVALPGDLALPELLGDAPIIDVAPEVLEQAAIAALDDPPLNLRQGDYAKRRRRALDTATLRRIAIWSGLILLLSLLIGVTTIIKNYHEASRLDDANLAIAQDVLPAATDPEQALVEMQGTLAARGAGSRAFTAPVSALLTAMQDTPGVALTTLSRDPDGMVRATLAAARPEDINQVLLAIQAAGFTITATSSQEPGGRMLADITVRS